MQVALPSQASTALHTVSVALVFAGFFVAEVPFAVATVPFLIAIVANSPSARAALVVPYFSAIAMMASWSLLLMGYSPLLTFVGLFAAVAAATLLTTILGVGLALSALLLLPFFPGHPLLAVGVIAPNVGLVAIPIILAALAITERFRSARLRVGVTVASVLVSVALWPAEHSAASGASARPVWEEVVTAIPRGYSLRSAATATRAVLERDSVYITGENMIRSDNRAQLSAWCEVLSDLNSSAYFGVQDVATGRSKVVLLRPNETCQTPRTVYAARVGIPGITGGIVPFGRDETGLNAGLRDVEWLACFEGFSLWSWIRAGLSSPSYIVVVSNDYWAEPLPVSRLRRKISANFERLLGVRVYHADANQNLLKEQNP